MRSPAAVTSKTARWWWWTSRRARRRAVSCHDIAAIWVGFVSRYQRSLLPGAPIHEKGTMGMFLCPGFGRDFYVSSIGALQANSPLLQSVRDY